GEHQPLFSPVTSQKQKQRLHEAAQTGEAPWHGCARLVRRLRCFACSARRRRKVPVIHLSRHIYCRSSSAMMMRILVPRSSRWVAKLWRSACSVTLFLTPAASAAPLKRRLSWRVVIGLPCCPRCLLAPTRCSNEAAGVHHASRRCGGYLAPCRA